MGEREPLLGVRPAKKPFYRPRPLWYVHLLVCALTALFPTILLQDML